MEVSGVEDIDMVNMLSKNEIRKFKRQVLVYLKYVNGYGYLKYSKRKHKLRIAVNKRTYWIIKSEMKE